ncbi:TetR/AcrR family transcriptional regulator [Gordonia lacunae]|uniref:TetR/AcrR family transcriptional regulator n=1 Tax=Gordonia lacunae TaxID=417102 RepID=UPI001FC9C255|nr:TetR/AcrR family transcriptional regulator [Gordonia lacunae]
MQTAKTRTALVRAGVELLEETGSPDVGLREIARRAGVSHGAPRRWFPTHRSLLAAVARDGLEDLSSELMHAADGSFGTVLRVASEYVAFARRRPAMFALIFRHDLLEGAGADLRSTSQPLFTWLVSLIEQRGAVVDPESRAAELWVGVHGIAMLSSTGALGLAVPGIDDRTLVERIVANSLRPSPGDPDR